jgi:hypothetical protein
MKEKYNAQKESSFKMLQKFKFYITRNRFYCTGRRQAGKHVGTLNVVGESFLCKIEMWRRHKPQRQLKFQIHVRNR